MSDPVPPALVAGSLATWPRAIGERLWLLEEVRGRLKTALRDLPPGAIDAPSPGHRNSIGTLLYHIAAVETDWLYREVLGAPFPLTVQALLPVSVRAPDGGLTPVHGQSLDVHLRRLDATRAVLLEGFRGMTVREFRRPRHLPQYSVTPEWVLGHLALHEAAHLGQICSARAGLRG